MKGTSLGLLAVCVFVMWAISSSVPAWGAAIQTPQAVAVSQEGALSDHPWTPSDANSAESSPNALLTIAPPMLDSSTMAISNALDPSSPQTQPSPGSSNAGLSTELVVLVILLTAICAIIGAVIIKKHGGGRLLADLDGYDWLFV